MPRRAHSALILTIVVAAVVTMSRRDTYAGTGDEPHYLVIAESIAFDGDLDLANNYAHGSVVHRAGLESEPHADRGRGEVLRPLHDIGLPLVFAPYVRLAAALSATPAMFGGAVVLAMALLTSLLALQLAAIFRRLGASEVEAAGWSLLLTLSPPLLSYSFLFFPEIASALLVASLFATLSDPRKKVTGRALLVGLAVGFLLLLNARNVALVVGFGAWAAAQLRWEKANRAAWLRFASGVAAAVVARGLVYLVFWGSPVSGLEPAVEWWTLPGEILSEVFVRISGLFFDQEFGVLPYAPLYLLTLAGMVRINERRRPEGRALVRIVVLFLAGVVLPYVNPQGWVGGWTPVGHMLAPVAPLLGVAVFTCARRLSGVARAAAWLLVALQIVVDVAIWFRPALLWNDGDGSNEFLARLPSLQQVIPVWHGPSPSPYPFIVAGVMWGAVSIYLARNARVTPDPSSLGRPA